LASPPNLTKTSPLYAHAAGVWAKKVKQRLHYFGPWADPQAALEKYLAIKDDLSALGGFFASAAAAQVPRPRISKTGSMNILQASRTVLPEPANPGEMLDSRPAVVVASATLSAVAAAGRAARDVAA
jgi:hypothetical protein